MEWVYVKVSTASGEPIDCGVVLDGQSSGRTFEKLMVGTGNHTFTLDTDIPHKPASVECIVRNTSEDDPDTVEFEPI